MDTEVMNLMERARRNQVGRLVVHAETTLNLEPLSAPEVVESMFPGNFREQTEWLAARLEEIGGPRYTQAWFGFDDGPAWPGMHDGSTWNGWAKPQFSREVADDIISFFNGAVVEGGQRSYYEKKEDAYILGWEVAEMEQGESLENYFYRRDAETGLYPLGSGSLTWNLYTDEEASDANEEYDMNW